MRGCEEIYYERNGLPRLLILSSLPLRGELRSITHQMTQAVKLVVKERGFRAGRFSVAYVSCDDTGADGDWSAERCGAHAREAARREKVIGVLLPIDLGCAEVALPPLAAARPGPLAQVAVLNSALALPKRGAVRLVAPLAAQVAADARFLRDFDARAIAVVDDGTAYGRRFAETFRRIAPELDQGIVEPEQAEGALVAGSLTPAGLRALRDLRGRLRPGAAIVLAPAFGAPAQIAAEAGRDAEGAYIGVAGLAGKAAAGARA